MCLQKILKTKNQTKNWTQKIVLFLIKKILLNDVNYQFKLLFKQHIQLMFHVFFVELIYFKTLF